MLQDKKNSKLGIIAGGGALPCLVADAALRENQPIHIVGIYGEADERIENYNHDWVKWGELGQLFRILKNQDCKEIVIIGSVKRPDLSQDSPVGPRFMSLPHGWSVAKRASMLNLELEHQISPAS